MVLSVELMKLLAGGLLLASLALVLAKIVSDRWALMKFKKLSKGLPMFPGARLIGNHISSLPFGEKNSILMRKWHDQLGKTIGWLMGGDFCVSTIDLDLIKTFIFDEPDTHLDRKKINLPLEEFDKSLLLASKDEWRQLRKLIAPAFT
jgi:hypothetical protein